MAINIRNNKSRRSKSSCTYCAGDHTITGCQKVRTDAKTGATKPFSERTFREHYAMQYIELKKSRKTSKGTSNKKCGYCKGTGHSRKSCSAMQEDEKYLIKANRAWRRVYAKESIEYGFAPASLIRYKERGAYVYGKGYQHSEEMYIVGSELPTNLSVFAIAGDYNLKQDIYIPAVGRKDPLCITDFIYRQPCTKALAGQGYHWGSVDAVQVMSPSSFHFSEEWINGDCDDIVFALKKWNRERIRRDLLDIIEAHLEPYARNNALWN